jgi:hypothetical protein
MADHAASSGPQRSDEDERLVDHRVMLGLGDHDMGRAPR